ncbi:MAG: SPOR domain-containing protein [Alcaligenaceae bacterium]|nr:SPOR domain-containing protein [Alcaligenaceae bacterium]
MFSRNAADSASGRRSATRGSGSTDAQLKELRSKARRRLIGALALVLAAVIIVPPLFDQNEPTELREPIVVPAPPTGLPDSGLMAGGGDVTADDPALAPTEPATPETAPADSADTAAPPAAVPAEPTEADTAAPSGDQDEAPAPEPEPEPAAKPKEPEPKAEPPAEPAAPPGRTDDGSVALALLAGKIPEDDARKPAKAAAQGSYVLQVAAYTTEQDANLRRDKLIESGVTNAYVERAQSSGKTVYRLRVGPFPTHEAAQAAQTRLRTLGYQNGLISSK